MRENVVPAIIIKEYFEKRRYQKLILVVRAILLYHQHVCLCCIGLVSDRVTPVITQVQQPTMMQT